MLNRVSRRVSVTLTFYSREKPTEPAGRISSSEKVSISNSAVAKQFHLHRPRITTTERGALLVRVSVLSRLHPLPWHLRMSPVFPFHGGRAISGPRGSALRNPWSRCPESSRSRRCGSSSGTDAARGAPGCRTISEGPWRAWAMWWCRRCSSVRAETRRVRGLGLTDPVEVVDHSGCPDHPVSAS